MHATAHLNLAPTWGFGWIAQFPGVPIFFAVSGYLVFDSLLRLHSLKRFAVRRAARIYPALAVNILIMEIALYVAGQIEFTRSLSAVWAFLFFVCYTSTASYNIASLWVGSGGGTLSFDGFFQIYPSGVLWTLTVELTFYAAVPLAALMKSRVSQTILIVAASVASFIFQKSLGPDSRLTVTITVMPYFWIFGIGMIFRLWPLPARLIVPSILTFLAVFTASVLLRNLTQFDWKSNPSSYDVLQTVILCSLVLSVGISPIFKSTMLALNDVSYGVYLYHMLIVAVLMNVPQGDRSQMLLLVVFGASILAGFFSWRLIERPIISATRH